jgi:hypothetical protein
MENRALNALNENPIGYAPWGKGVRPDFSKNEQTFSRFVVNSLHALPPQMVYG